MTPNSSTDSATRDGLKTVEYQRRPNDIPNLKWEATTEAFVLHETFEEGREFWDVRELVDRVDADTLLAASRAEVERLREALRQIAEVVPGGWHKDDGTHVANSFIHSARAALSTKKD